MESKGRNNVKHRKYSWEYPDTQKIKAKYNEKLNNLAEIVLTELLTPLSKSGKIPGWPSGGIECQFLVELILIVLIEVLSRRK